MVISKVLSGDGTGELIEFKNKRKGFFYKTKGGKQFLNKDTVERFEIVTENNQQSFGGTIAKTLIGGALFGGIGAIAGAASDGGTAHVLAVTLKTGDQIAIQLNDIMYNEFIRELK